MLKILMVTFPDELLKNLKVEMKHKTRKRNHTFELIHSDLERRKAMIHNLCFYWFAFLCFLCTPSNERSNHLGKGAKDRSKWTQGVAKQVFWKSYRRKKNIETIKTSELRNMKLCFEKKICLTGSCLLIRRGQCPWSSEKKTTNR